MISIAQAMEENRPRNTRPSSPETLFNSGDDDDHRSVAGNTVINNAEFLRETSEVIKNIWGVCYLGSILQATRRDTSAL